MPSGNLLCYRRAHSRQHEETLLQQAAMRAQRNVPISAKGAALAQLAELKRSGVKRSDQFEVPHRAHPICGRPADTRPSCLIR